jgi:RHS repeat-associated protein
LTDATGEVTYSSRYTPWGSTLETYGTGNFEFGYFGGLMDAATGLLYVGDGQYYDPATGRFLNRDAKPKQDNPYTPFDPMGMLFAPLGLMALVYGRKKKGSKWAVLLVILSFAVVTGMTLSGCGGSSTPTPGKYDVTVAPNAAGTQIAHLYQNGTEVGTIVVPPTSTPIPTATYTCTVTPTPTPTPTCPICGVNQNAQMLYDAVISQKNNLPPGFSVALLFAVAAVETGGNNPAYQNSVISRTLLLYATKKMNG